MQLKATHILSPVRSRRGGGLDGVCLLRSFLHNRSYVRAITLVT